ncbi:MAG: hypothetical protein ACE1Y2_00520, partial [Stenotrophomonas maltophilia]
MAHEAAHCGVSGRQILPVPFFQSRKGVHIERLLDVMRRDGTDQFNSFQRVAFTIPATARLTGVQDRFDIAESTAETVLSDMSPTPHTARFVKVGLALLAVQR